MGGVLHIQGCPGCVRTETKDANGRRNQGRNNTRKPLRWRRILPEASKPLHSHFPQTKSRIRRRFGKKKKKFEPFGGSLPCGDQPSCPNSYSLPRFSTCEGINLTDLTLQLVTQKTDDDGISKIKREIPYLFIPRFFFSPWLSQNFPLLSLGAVVSSYALSTKTEEIISFVY